MPEKLTPLQKLNLEASVADFQKDEAILGKYRDKGFQTFSQAMDWLSGEIHSLEQELEEDED